MQIKRELPFQTFNDGICRIYSVKNVGGKGNLPVNGLVEKAGRVPYERRRVGVERFYSAKKKNVKIELMIRIPEAFDVSPNDICILGETQYEVEQAQEARDIMPGAKDLALKRVEKSYGLGGI